MSAQVIIGKAIFTISGADHLSVEGDLVQIQRSSPSGYETVAVAGEDLFVTIEPAVCTTVETWESNDERRKMAAVQSAVGSGEPTWHPGGDPADTDRRP